MVESQSEIVRNKRSWNADRAETDLAKELVVEAAMGRRSCIKLQRIAGLACNADLSRAEKLANTGPLNNL